MPGSLYDFFRNSRPWGVATIIATLCASVWLTYMLGGTGNALPHLAYVPIVVAAALYGVPGGIIAGIAAGVSYGPWMPNDVALDLPQTVENWTLRLVIFVGIGALVGHLIRRLAQRITDLRDLNEQTIIAFVQAVDAKDPHTAEHSVNVAHYAQAIAVELGLSVRDIDRIRHAALLHDIGKIAVPGSVLNKPAKPTPDEWTLIRQHPVASAKIISGIKQYNEYVPGVRHHHERMDGQGYPDKLPGADIPLDARILAVADAFEAMTSDRAYRPALTTEQAIEELRVHSGTQFDGEVVDALLRALADGIASGDG